VSSGNSTRTRFERFVPGAVLVCVGCLLVVLVAERLPRGDAILFIAGAVVAVFSFLAARRLLRSPPNPGAPAVQQLAANPRATASDLRPLADDLNQALCAITANADAIVRLIDRQPPELDEVRAALADIVSDAERASRTIQNAEGRQAIVAVADDIDVAQLLDQFVQRLRGEMASRQVTCEVETAAQLPGIRGFREQLLQLFTRLVTTLLEAMPGHERRERRLRVRASRQGGAVAISIEDSGAGIGVESVARLCDPSCRRIVHAHGGRIAVTRGAGGGAALQVILPASS
jgi:C4-dicarboxylate-specific signal transduction histidine kinase